MGPGTLSARQEEGKAVIQPGETRGAVKKDVPGRGCHRNEGPELSELVSGFVFTLSYGGGPEPVTSSLFGKVNGSRHILRESPELLTCHSSHIWKIGLILSRLAEWIEGEDSFDSPWVDIHVGGLTSHPNSPIESHTSCL